MLDMKREELVVIGRYIRYGQELYSDGNSRNANVRRLSMNGWIDRSIDKCIILFVRTIRRFEDWKWKYKLHILSTIRQHS